MDPKNLIFIPEDAFGYLVEQEPIEIAAILAEKRHPGRSSTKAKNLLLDCVVLNPDYLPPEFREHRDYELMKVRGRRIGRTLDILLDEPLTVEETGEQCRILTFKGCGAFPPREQQKLVIEPYAWPATGDAPTQLGRIWGALIEQGAAMEAGKDFREVTAQGVHMTPYLSANTMPLEVLRQIYSRGEPQAVLAQAVRLATTNILMKDLFGHWEKKYGIFELDSFINAEILLLAGDGASRVDLQLFLDHVGKQKAISSILELIASLATAQKKLGAKGKTLQWVVGSELIDNCYVDGRLKDFENFTIGKQEEDALRVLASAYGEIMPNIVEPILRYPGEQRVFLGFKDVIQFVQENGPGPIVLKKPAEGLPKHALPILQPDYGLPLFAIVGFAAENGGFTTDIFESYRRLSLADAICLDNELREKGYRLCTRAHFLAAWKKNKRGLFDALCHNSLRVHTISAIDAETKTLYDNLVLNGRGEIDFSASRALKLEANPQIGRIVEWDAALCPRIEKNDGPGDQFYHGPKEKKGIFPVFMSICFDSYYLAMLADKASSESAAWPLVIYEFPQEQI